MTTLEFYRLIDGILELPPGTITGNEQFSDLEGWDSLAVIGFMAAVDKNLHFVIPPKELVSARSIADLHGLVANKLTN